MTSNDDHSPNTSSSTKASALRDESGPNWTTETAHRKLPAVLAIIIHQDPRWWGHWTATQVLRNGACDPLGGSHRSVHRTRVDARNYFNAAPGLPILVTLATRVSPDEIAALFPDCEKGGVQ